ncbi:hypothetical protein KSP39_PZI014438 [Platanthera zijinensis]|uniref:Uncharacterized protein n=1 Tax=Platanthera zijinensis TaxID=2320716 RepID=A0AAP0B9I3_9ASPA
MVAISPKRTNLEGDGDLVRYLSSKIPEVCEEGKCESDCVRSSVEVGTHNILPYPIITGSGFTNYDFKPFIEVKKVDEMLHDESISINTFDSCNNYSGECQIAYIWKNNQLLSPHVEKHQCLPIDVVGNVNATGSPAEQLDQNSYGMIIGGDSKKTIQVLFDESSSKSMTAEGDTCANVKVDNSNSYSLSGENSSLCNAASPQTNSPKLINSVSEEIMVDTKVIPSLLISYGECRIPGNVYVDNSEKNSLEIHFDYEEHSSDSTIYIDHATGLEKVDLLGDDDSQNEDGELQKSVLNSCEEDEVEEVETEHVGYGSNCREAESFEAKSEFCPQSDLAVGTTKCKPEGWILSTCDVNRFWAIEGSQFKCFQKHSTIKDISNAIYGEGHSHGRSRVWVDPQHHHVNCRFDISGNYSSPKFPLPGSRNAAAAAIANFKRNGFVVAPDETVISTRRGSSIDSDGDFHMLAEVSNSRNVSPGKCFNAGKGRDSRYGSRLFSPYHANRYHSPILQYSSSKRQHSFSPHRRPPHLACEHTRSPSRSRTRSPHTWTSLMI